MAFRVPTGGFRLPAADMHPPVMAIGDSLYNGMRSATINGEYAARSIPAMVAKAVAPDHPFRWPRYPESLLINVEETLRRVSLLNFRRALQRTLEFALSSANRYARCDYALREPVLAWDNLAISGAEVEHLTDWSYDRWNREVLRIMPRLDGVGSIGDLSSLGDDLLQLHLGLNARFLLNPGNERALDPLTPMDWVVLRQPRMLLISIGANHGLIDITLSGSEAGGRQRPRPGVSERKNGLRSLWDWARDMGTFAETLTALPAATEEIYINTVPLPSTVPNLTYPTTLDTFLKVDLRQSEDDYFPLYENRLGGLSDYAQFTGAEVRELDQEVLAINEAMIANVRRVFDAAGDSRARFFRVDQTLKRYDGKHVDALKVRQRRPRIDLEKDDHAYSNEAFVIADTWLGNWLRDGGVGSLDNHHPSGLGYAVFARELLEFMQASGVAVDPGRQVISEHGDRVLLDPPDAYQTLFSVLYKVRRHKAGLPLQPRRDEALGLRGTAAASTAAPPLPLDAEEEQAAPLAAYMSAVLGKGR
ncbi:MAG: hypothetical protein KDC18_13640 [Alphaproteobacteria bacterium]|nr:hypothetical protein [Alphaproteobacteria bacterium]MCB9930995.1 hypothetical protein [Alphaproteobacteria bacterium]